MPDLGVPAHRPRQSHTGTQQWQSFEIRMRYRRAERCLLKAEAALDAGMEDEARAALAEARTLNPDVPAFEEVLAAARTRRRAAMAAARRTKVRRSSVAAALLVAVGSLGVWVYQRGGTPLPDPAGVTLVNQRPPAAAVARTPASFEVAPPAAQVLAGNAGEPAPAQVPPARPEPDPPSADPPIAGRSTPPTPSPAPVVAAVDAAPPVQPEPMPTTGDALAAQPPIAATAKLDGVGTAVSAPPPPVTAPAPRPAPAPVPEVAAPAAAQSQEPAVRAALARFEAAYTGLSASAAQEVWPTVDARSLERAFANLESQRVSLGNCAVKVAAAAARAECTGTTTWTPKVGGGSRTERRRWEFDLALADGRWFIVRAEAR